MREGHGGGNRRLTNALLVYTNFKRRKDERFLARVVVVGRLISLTISLFLSLIGLSSLGEFVYVFFS